MRTPKSRRRDSRYRSLAALALGLLLSSCGGGGGAKPDAGDGGETVTPRLIAPLSTSMVRELRPTLRWTGGGRRSAADSPPDTATANRPTARNH